MRERVLAAVEELGYEPNWNAQSLRRGSTLSVGFVVRDISNPEFSEIVLGAEATLRDRGYSVLLVNSEGSSQLDAEHIRLFRRRRVDGVLLSVADESDEATIQELMRLDVPYVLIDRELPSAPESSAVLPEAAKGVREATEHLVALGHRRVGLVATPASTRPGREVRRGFEEACTAHDLDGTVEIAPFTPQHGASATELLLDRSPAPTAMICGNNTLLPGVLGVLRARRLTVPDDISIITVDEVRLLEFIDPPLAAVSCELLTIGREAAALLLRLLEGHAPHRVSIPTRFIPRASCAPAPMASQR